MISIHKNFRSISVGALYIGGSVLALAGCDAAAAPEKPIRPVITMVAGDVERFRTDTFPGRAKATQEVNVSFEVSGKMIERRVNVGDQVKSGDVLAVLEPDRFEAEVKRLLNEEKRRWSWIVSQLRRLEPGMSALPQNGYAAIACSPFEDLHSTSGSFSTKVDLRNVEAGHLITYAVS